MTGPTMQHARVDGGEVTATRLPRVGRLADGRTVSGYHRLPPATLYAEGWRPLVDGGPPDHDPQTHYPVRTGYVYDADDDVVGAVWELREVPPDPDDGHHDPPIGAPDA